MGTLMGQRKWKFIGQQEGKLMGQREGDSSSSSNVRHIFREWARTFVVGEDVAQKLAFDNDNGDGECTGPMYNYASKPFGYDC
jgi:hypothetical protein